MKLEKCMLKKQITIHFVFFFKKIYSSYLNYNSLFQTLRLRCSSEVVTLTLWRERSMSMLCSSSWERERGRRRKNPPRWSQKLKRAQKVSHLTFCGVRESGEVRIGFEKKTTAVKISTLWKDPKDLGRAIKTGIFYFLSLITQQFLHLSA